MRLIKASYNIAIFSPIFDSLTIESAGRICYKSDVATSDTGRKAFIKRLKDMGHHSVLEHSRMSVHFVIDRGVSHELVRHRLCSFSQESTRYCNYEGGVTFIIPPWVDEVFEGEYIQGQSPTIEYGPQADWFDCMQRAENYYIGLVSEGGWTPQQARSVLPNSLKTEIIVTTNYREWMHIFKLRCDKSAHPQMREVMIPLRDEVASQLPEVFG